MPLKSGSSRATISYNIRKLKREHRGDPKWPHKRIVAAALNNARRTGRGRMPGYLRRRPARENAVTSTDYWIGISIILVGAVALWGWKNMGAKAQATALQ